MTHGERLAQINDFLASSAPAWAHIEREINNVIAQKIEQLVTENSEETRGRIKALRELIDLPEALQQEREGLTAALSDEDAANN